MLKFTTGNLFEYGYKVDAIVNTVNCVGVMGKGIALEFKKRYPENFNYYKKVCSNKELLPGKMLMFLQNSNGYPRYIVNFPTKNHWRYPSKIEYISDGLDDLVNQIKKHSIQSISIPALGCGNGGLDWEDVKKLIKEKLQHLDDVEIIVYEPSSNKIQKKTTKTEKKTTTFRMTRQRALLLLLMDHYNLSSYKDKVTYEEVNHLAFIAQCLGANLKLEFVEDSKGPFDQKINKLLLLMASNEYLSIQKGDSGDNIILVNNKRFKQKNNVLKNEDTAGVYEKALKILKGFETKERLKVLTVTLWFYKEKGCNPDDLYEEVQKWFLKHGYSISDIAIRDSVQRIVQFYEVKMENMSFDI
ncbi:type II toxin-antitoxin system antitoxin DNA ADP-ribosyl glycohydrolase DarG [Bacillus cereus]|uniref:type II toxin-antitoxin system antitoxin DNA ADP-ribosyl glycohydrolase DarG n=1 Tax=Bacillus cereus TaxID=1396 RepID=UPI0024BECA12|nr:macro domain-containing protein [Bacillus cereus]